MIEQVYNLSKGDQKVIEKILFDDNIHYLHMIFPKGNAMPTHITNSNVYLTVLRGTLSISLEGLEYRNYTSGTVLKIPKGTKMNSKNDSDETLEITVVKAPAPEN